MERSLHESLIGQPRMRPVWSYSPVAASILITRLPSAFIPVGRLPRLPDRGVQRLLRRPSNANAFDNSMSWYAPLAVIQGAAFVGVGAGFSATREIETGFYDRLLLSPAPLVSLLFGPGLATILRSFVPLVTVIAVGMLGGAELPGGVVGLATLTVAAIGVALLHCFWCVGLAYRFKSQRAAPIMQIGVFVTNFLATAQVPLVLMTGWLHTVARINPMTNVFRLGRAGWIEEVTWHNTAGGLLALAVFIPLAFWFAWRGLKRMIP